MKIRRQSSRGINPPCTDIIEMKDGYIVDGLVLSVEDAQHSIAPESIKITYADGSWHEYSLDECPLCHRKK